MWKNLFREHILARGYDYYERKLVSDISITDSLIEATVHGSRDYRVEIIREGDDFLELLCSCPYAADGSHCKHLAAVLFLAEEDGKITGTLKTKSQESPREMANKLIENADEAMIKDFLVDLMVGDGRILHKFKALLGYEITPSDIRRYKAYINDIFYEYSDGNYFIDYENAWDFTSNLDDFLHEYIQIMIDKKQLKEAFELLAYLFLKLARQGVDDSSGGTDLVADRCQEMWKEIIDKSELSLKKEQFKWFIEHVDSPDTDYMGEYLEEVLLEKFKEEEFHDHKLLYIEKKSQGYRKEELSRYRRRKLGELALRHIEILELKKISGKEIESYCKDNLELSLIREYLVDFYLEKKKYDRAIKLLKEGKKRDADDREVVANYSLKLKDLYKKLGEQDSYRDELWLLVLEYLPGEEELFDELKALYTKKEWIKKRERIFESLSLSSDRARFYAKEGLYERLLACVVKANGLGLLRSYEKDLKDIYPQELLQKYEDTLEDMASYTTNRKYYQEIVLILKRMEAYPGGETRVNKLVSEWRLKYKNRSAMMDELKKLPFIRLDLIDRFPGWN